MDQNLDLQIAALIFLGGTQNLVSGSDHGGVETMSDEGEVEAEPGNTIKHNLQIPENFFSSEISQDSTLQFNYSMARR
tara:strand:+ start:388 stop:621 length:234 start_codon:yes stop_codon:yes gene_type:complete